MNRRMAIVGDVHGQADQLENILDLVTDRDVVLLGDYVNRGQATRRTLDILLNLKVRQPSTVFLLGNHDLLLLDFLDGRVPFVKFAALGGLPTIRSYTGHTNHDVREELIEALPETHRQFLLACAAYYETSEMIISHCGVKPQDPESRAMADMVMTTHLDLLSGNFRPPKLVICGHYSQRSHAPYVADNLICIDTGCGSTGAPLTALLLPEGTFVQR